MIKKVMSWILVIAMLMSIHSMQITAFDESSEDLDLSYLSEITEKTIVTKGTYSYEWTVEESGGETVRTLELTLDGANIKALSLPCKSYGKVNVNINTVNDSYISEICESSVFQYSYQWDTITFSGEGILEIEYMNTQGGGNDHTVTVCEGANVKITGDTLYALSFGASGSNGSTLNVEGSLSVNGVILCGQTTIGKNGHLVCKRLELAGRGAFDVNETKDAFVLKEGGKLEAVGQTDWIDDVTGEQYAALSVVVPYDDLTPVEDIINLPENILPNDYSLYKLADSFATIDDGGILPSQGVIYAATSLKLPAEPETYTVVWKNHDGAVLETDENVVAGTIPEYNGATPTKASSAEYTYTFDKWSPDVEAVNKNAEYVATYKKTPVLQPPTVHVITFETNGGSIIADAYVDEGEKLAKPVDPTRSGYKFDGWYADSSFADKYDFESAVTASFSLYAKWSSVGAKTVKYKLTYVTNGGNYIASEKHPERRYVTLFKVPERNGYAFEGWYLDEALTVSVTAVKMDKDITVYAKWVDDNGGAGHGHTTPEDLNGDEHFAYIVGYDDGTVKPGSYITRAEVTTIFFRLLKAEIRDKNLTSSNAFSDVPETKWYNIAVSTMAKLGIVNGKYLNLFAPDEFITRAEFAAICARFDDSEFEIADSFTDVNGHWAEAEIHEAAAHGWIKGYEDGTFRPDEFITRAEAMTMINRVLNRVPETEADLLEGMIEWPDNSDKSAWYYLIVQEATNSHKYDMKNHIYEKWTVLQPVADWSKYQ